MENSPNQLSFIEVYMTEFFYLLDKIFMLFSYENRKKNHQLFFPAFEACYFRLGTILHKDRRLGIVEL